MIFQEQCKVIENKEVAPQHFKLALISPDIALSAKPGQFVNVKCSKDYSPLLRRPLSVHRVDRREKTFELLYRVVGKGTEILSHINSGEEIDVLGPLGNGFKIDETKKTALLIGGGMGIAPLLYLAEELAKKKKKILVMLGNKTKELILCEKDFKKLGAEVYITTEDGSYGKKGMVTDLFKNQLSTINYQLSTIYSCGPKEMLRIVSGIALTKEIETQVCLEEMMGCGLGGCYSCVVKTKSGYQRVCKEGPVFEAKEIIW